MGYRALRFTWQRAGGGEGVAHVVPYLPDELLPFTF